jgi:hypothetical protein
MTASTAKPDVSRASERGLDLADQGPRYLPRQPSVGFSLIASLEKGLLVRFIERDHIHQHDGAALDDQ